MADGSPAPRRRGRIAVRALLVAAALGVALVLAEVGVRVLDPLGTSYYHDFNDYLRRAIVFPDPEVTPESRIFQQKPDLDLELRCFRLVTDNLGLRRESPGHVTPAGGSRTERQRTRILFLGDSVTFGWGVDDEHTWLRLLEREATDAEGRPLECLNAGHPMYNTLQEADWLAAHGELLAPDAVVLTFVVNDLDDAYGLYTELVGATVRAGGEMGARADPPRVSLKARLLEWFRGLRAVYRYYERKGEHADRVRIDPSEVESRADYQEGWPRAEAGLERLLQLCQDLDAPLIVLDHATPWIPGVKRWCEANAVPWFAFDFTREEKGMDIYNSPADPHANARGNALLRDKAHAALAEAGILAPPAPAGG